MTFGACFCVYVIHVGICYVWYLIVLYAVHVDTYVYARMRSFELAFN